MRIKMWWLGLQQNFQNSTRATAMDTKLEESDPFIDVEEDEDELEENKLVPEDC